jgi:glycosyltransferase involved in cell wall biosynthesis
LANAYFQLCQASRMPGDVVRNFLRVRKNLQFAGRADGFIANSHYMKETLKTAGLPSERIRVLNCFTGLRHNPEIKPLPGRILFLGRVAEAKGVDILLEALSQVDSRLEWFLVIAGDGYYLPQIKRMVTDCRLEKRVHFTGWVTGREKVRLLHEAAVVVVPSLWPEPFGMVGIEAMACARPVIAFDVGGIGDWLTTGVNGFLSAVGEVRDLADSIGRLLTDTKLAGEMGQAGLKNITLFRIENHINQLNEIYETAIK